MLKLRTDEQWTATNHHHNALLFEGNTNQNCCFFLIHWLGKSVKACIFFWLSIDIKQVD